MAPDPYRVLGLPADASIAEVKRAYRRLAKANHPDSAGDAALPRFLEIQHAYESITTVAWRPGMRRPASATASEPWRADPARARTARGASSGAGPRPTGTRGRAGGPAGSTGDAGPADAAGHAGPRRSRTGDATGPEGRGKAAPGSGAGTGGRRRSAKKATFGSTTYDEAREQADTTWSGASWYGPTSGEYWRVNPREYADPRKHGPEYLAKAAARAAAAAERRARQDQAASAGGLRGDGAPAAVPPLRRARAGASPGATVPPRPESSPRPDRPRDPAWAHTEAGERAGGTAGPPPVASAAALDPAFGDRPFGIVLTPGLRRILRALLAWPPLGIAAAAVIGEATGCASFEATCTPTADLYPWVAQAAILLALLALPAVARTLAGGTIAVALLAFPVAAALSAGGATYDRTRGPAALIAVLAIVWVGGVAAVLVRRAVTRAIP